MFLGSQELAVGHILFSLFIKVITIPTTAFRCSNSSSSYYYYYYYCYYYYYYYYYYCGIVNVGGIDH